MVKRLFCVATLLCVSAQIKTFDFETEQQTYADYETYSAASKTSRFSVNWKSFVDAVWHKKDEKRTLENATYNNGEASKITFKEAIEKIETAKLQNDVQDDQQSSHNKVKPQQLSSADKTKWFKNPTVLAAGAVILGCFVMIYKQK